MRYSARKTKGNGESLKKKPHPTQIFLFKYMYAFVIKKYFLLKKYFYAPVSKDRGHIVFGLSVCLSVVCLSAKKL